jgi:hypothetical protein
MTRLVMYLRVIPGLPDAHIPVPAGGKSGVSLSRLPVLIICNAIID